MELIRSCKKDSLWWRSKDGKSIEREMKASDVMTSPSYSNANGWNHVRSFDLIELTRALRIASRRSLGLDRRPTQTHTPYAALSTIYAS